MADAGCFFLEKTTILRARRLRFIMRTCHRNMAMAIGTRIRCRILMRTTSKQMQPMRQDLAAILKALINKLSSRKTNVSISFAQAHTTSARCPIQPR
jgi:hypothetical protein